MLAMPGLRAFALAAKRGSEGVSCDAQGVFAGGVPLLEAPDAGNQCWRARPVADLNKDLAARYRLPIDIAAKTGALNLIAAAFNRGDLAMAAIAAVQMQLPDPPPLARRTENSDEIAHRARELFRSGLLKFWDPAEHPRAGVPPNPGWFTSTDGSDQQSFEAQSTPRPQLAIYLDEGMIVPCPVSMVPGIGDCLGNFGGGLGSGAESDFARPRSGSESGDDGGFQPKLPFPEGLPLEQRPAAEAPPIPSGASPKAPAPAQAQPPFEFPGGLPRQRAPARGAAEPAGSDSAEIPARGGRLGNAATRAQNAAIAAELGARGYIITGGGATGEAEEFIPGDGPGVKGGTFVDITAVNQTTGKTLRVQTVDTLADGKTPTPREQEAAARVRQARPNDELILIPKRRMP